MSDQEEKISLYEKIFQNSLDAILIADDSGKYIDANPAACELTGYTKKELLQLAIWDITPKENQLRGKKIWEEFILAGTLEGEYEIIRKDNSRIFTYFSASANIEKGRHFTTLKDITEKRKIEKAILNQQKETDTILAKMINAFVIFESVFDANGKFVSCRFIKINKAYENITGVTQKEVQGKTIHEVWPGTETEWIKRYGDVAVTGKAQEFELYHKPVKKLYHCRVFRPFNTNEKFCVLFEDITHKKAVEKNLIESEKKYRTFFENDLTGDYLSTPRFGIIDCNPTFAKILGYNSVEEVLKSDVNDLYDHKSIRDEFLKRLKREKVIEKNEITMHRKDGTTVDVVENVVGYFDKDGKLLQFQGFILDISDIKMAQKAKREADDRLRNIMLNTSNMFYQHDVNHNLSYVSPQVERILGYTPEEAMKKWTDFVSDNPINEKGIEKTIEAIKTGKPQGTYFLELVHKNGNKVWVEVRETPIKENGKVTSIIGSLLDITDRKLAEQENKEVKELLEQVYASLTDALFVVNIKGPRTIISCNSAVEKVFGYTVDEVIGKTTEFLHVDTKAYKQFGQMLFSALDSRGYFAAEFEVKRKNGEIFESEHIVTEIKDENGDIKYVVSIVRDISGRKKAENALKESEEFLARTGEIAKVGGWEMDLLDNGKAKWTKTIYDIVEIDYLEPIPGLFEHTDWYLPEYRDMIKKKIENLINTKKPMVFEAKLKTKTGKIKWTRAEGKVVEVNGVVVKIRGTFQDITERKLAEKALRKSEERLSNIANSIPGTIYQFVSTKDGSFAFQYVSDRAKELLGYDIEKFKDIEYIFSRIHPDDYNYVLESVEKVTKEALDWSLEFRVLNNKNEVVWIKGQSTASLDENGNVVHNGVFLDVTEKKNAEVKLKESETRYRELFDNINSGVAVYDVIEDGKDFVFKEFNRAGEKIDGQSKDELIGKSIFDVRPNVEKFGLIDIMRKVYKTGKPASHPITFYEDEAVSGWFENFIYKLPSNEIVAVFDNVTEKKRAEIAIRESEEKYRSLFEQQIEAYAYHKIILDENGKPVDYKFINVNDQFLIQTGLESKNEIIGKTAVELWPDLEKSWIDTYGEIALTGIGKSFESYSTPLAKHFKVSAYSPQKGYFATSFLDITKEKIAEQELKKLHNEMVLAQKVSKLGYWTFDVKTQMPTWSSELFAIYGIPEEKGEPSYKEHKKITHPNDWEKFDSAVQRLISKKEPYDLQIRSIHSDGKIVWLRTLGFCRVDDNGKVYELYGTAMDISVLKESEIALRESEEKFRMLFTKAPIGILTVNLEGKILQSNEAAQKTLEYSSEELINLNFESFTYPEDINISKEKVIQLVNNEFQSTQFEKRYVTKSGQIIWVNIHTFLIRNNEDKPLYFITHLIDITEKKKAESELKDRERKYRNVVENSPVGIFRSTESGNIIWVNPAMKKILGLKEDVLPDKLTSVEFYKYPEHRKEFIKILKSEGFVKGFETVFYNYDGVEIDVRINAHASKSDGEISFEGILEDITTRKETERAFVYAKEQAEKSDKLKGEFLAQMSHEIRTPLNAILNSVSFLKEDFDMEEDEAVTESFLIIDHAGKRLVRTIESIINMSDLNAGTFEMIIKRIDLKADIFEVIEKEFRQLAAQKNLNLSFIYLTEQLFINGDEYSILQIFENIIDNAIKFTDEGNIEVRVLENNNKLEVQVSDTGIGMTEEFLKNIFIPFSQEEQGYTRKYEGNGLGLSLVKSYCDLNNAEISVESKKGIGSIFKIIFK